MESELAVPVIPLSQVVEVMVQDTWRWDPSHPSRWLLVNKGIAWFLLVGTAW